MVVRDVNKVGGGVHERTKETEKKRKKEKEKEKETDPGGQRRK